MNANKETNSENTLTQVQEITLIDIARLKEVVSDNIPMLSKVVLPNGRERYGEWRAGNTAGDPGDSLGIRLTGQKKGVWIDRATGECGDFVSLVQLHLGCGFREAVDWIERTVGIGLTMTTQEAGEKKKSFRQPKPVFPATPPDLSAGQLWRMAGAARRLAQHSSPNLSSPCWESGRKSVPRW